MRVLIPITCVHDGDAGVLRDGRPRCPMCRRDIEHEQFEREAKALTADFRARAAGDDTTLWTD